MSLNGRLKTSNENWLGWPKKKMNRNTSDLFSYFYPFTKKGQISTQSNHQLRASRTSRITNFEDHQHRGTPTSRITNFEDHQFWGSPTSRHSCKPVQGVLAELAKSLLNFGWVELKINHILLLSICPSTFTTIEREKNLLMNNDFNDFMIISMHLDQIKRVGHSTLSHMYA